MKVKDVPGGTLVIPRRAFEELVERIQCIASIMAVADTFPTKEELDCGYDEALSIVRDFHALLKGGDDG